MMFSLVSRKFLAMRNIALYSVHIVISYTCVYNNMNIRCSIVTDLSLVLQQSYWPKQRQISQKIAFIVTRLVDENHTFLSKSYHEKSMEQKLE